MARLSKSDAARIIGVTRQTLYRYLTQGRISASPDGTIDTAELLRASFVLQGVTDTGDVTSQRHTRHDVTSTVTPVIPASETALLHQMIALLQREVEEVPGARAGGTGAGSTPVAYARAGATAEPALVSSTAQLAGGPEAYNSAVSMAAGSRLYALSPRPAPTA